MSDERVRAALRSDAHLVVVEAPAGCGKTYQGSHYARDVLTTLDVGRPLILTHTHAACSVFAEGTRGSSRVDIRTIDSVIGTLGGAYHSGMGLPTDVAGWIRQRPDGYGELAAKVANLLRRHPMIAAALARRYPIIICDEHQDSSVHQHAIVMSLLNQGAKLRIFADPMQQIFRNKSGATGDAAWDWDEVKRSADAVEELDLPHRWNQGCKDLGAWTLSARAALKSGGVIDLRGRLPASITVVYAENRAQRNLEFQLSSTDRRAIDAFEKEQTALLILTAYNATARSMRSFFFRRIPLWEGHVRQGLETLVSAINAAGDDRAALAAGVVAFLANVGKGFSPSEFGDRFEQEASEGCSKPCKGKPATIQNLARFIVAEPNHRGVARMLRRLHEVRDGDPAFSTVKIDCNQEFWDAARLGEFDSAETGLAEIVHRRTYLRPKPPPRAISTIHKAKGLECESVILMPCDGKTFPDKPETRCLLYVALSRAMKRLLLVVSRDNPSPLIKF